MIAEPPATAPATRSFGSGIVLVAMNLIPLFGAVFAGWSTFAIVVLYWIENLIIGAVNVLRMATCRAPAGAGTDSTTSPGQAGAKAFLIPFFVLHYGIFCVVHGVFVFVLLGGRSGAMEFGDWSEALWGIFVQGGGWFILGVAASHLYSFYRNYLQGGEYRRVTLPELMEAPYPRVMVLHIAIVLGAFFVITLGSPLPLLVIFIAGKTLLDWRLHRREHRKWAAPGA